MPFEVPRQEGEVVRSYDVYRPKPDVTPYGMAVSDRALFVLAKRPGLQYEPWFFKRVHLSSVRAVHLKRAFPIGLYLLSAALVIGGVAAVVFMLGPVMDGQGGVVKAAPFFAVAYGLFLFYSAVGQRCVVIETVEGAIKMAPPTTLGIPDKATIRRIQESFLEACSSVGLSTFGHRSAGVRAAQVAGRGGAAN